MNHCC